ncbi:MAG: hypothetical protein ACE5J3_14345, partial [Methanosarcinales archaeon]
MAITPEKWGLLEVLPIFEAAKILLENNIHNRSIISRAYYGRYHAVRAVVYIKMHLDVQEHKKLIKKF